MLFLAVFLGFIAENVREHAIEKDRSHQYASQLVSDLRIDSARLDIVSDDTVLLQRLSNFCRARQLWIRYRLKSQWNLLFAELPNSFTKFKHLRSNTANARALQNCREPSLNALTPSFLSPVLCVLIREFLSSQNPKQHTQKHVGGILTT